MGSGVGPTCSDGYNKCFAYILILEWCVGLQFQGRLSNDLFEEGFQFFMIEFGSDCF